MKKKIAVISALLLIVVLAAVGARFFTQGVTINNVTVPLSNLGDSEDIVLAGMDIPDVITDGTDMMEDCIKWSFDEEYKFSVGDLLNPVEIPVSCTVDEETLRILLDGMNASLSPTSDAYIDMDAKEVVAEVYGEQIDVDAAIKAVVEAAQTGGTVTLSDYKLTPSVVSADLQDGVDDYWAHKNWSMKYDGTVIVAEVPDEALSLTEDGVFEIVDFSFLDDYVRRAAVTLGSPYDGYQFTTHDGSVVTIEAGTLGDVVDKEGEKEELVALFKSAKSDMERVPVYSSRVDDGFDTYVEVSLSEQHVWLYQDGEPIMDSYCVSGTKGTTRETPKGLYYMDVVMPGKTLYPSGDEKGTWVDRWMRFTPDGCGLHDATWRSKFGGNIYLTNGSHGCVNLPPSFAYDLYEYAYVGLPVVVY